jgi:hypothetical protein
MLSNVKIKGKYHKLEIVKISQEEARKLDIRSDVLRGIGHSAEYGISGSYPNGEPVDQFPTKGLWVQFPALTKTIFGSAADWENPIKGYFITQ